MNAVVAIDEDALHFFDRSTGAVIYDHAPQQQAPDIASRDLAGMGDSSGA